MNNKFLTNLNKFQKELDERINETCISDKENDKTRQDFIFSK